MADDTYDEIGENNDKQVLLSEEVEFLEGLADDLGGEYRSSVLDRIDIIRAAMSTAEKPDPDAQPDEGIASPEQEEKT